MGEPSAVTGVGGCWWVEGELQGARSPFSWLGVACASGHKGCIKGRRSTIEVHPKFSEAPHLRNSIPLPETDFCISQNASRRIIPWPESTKRFFFEIKIDNPMIWGRGSPSFRN